MAAALSKGQSRTFNTCTPIANPTFQAIPPNGTHWLTRFYNPSIVVPFKQTIGVKPFKYKA